MSARDEHTYWFLTDAGWQAGPTLLSRAEPPTPPIGCLAVIFFVSPDNAISRSGWSALQRLGESERIEEALVKFGREPKAPFGA